MLKLVVYRSRIFYRYMILLDHDRCNPTFICSYIYVHFLPLKSSYFLLIVKSTPLFRSHTHFLLIDFQIFSEKSFVFHTVHRSIVLLMVMFCCAFRYEPDLEHEPWWPLACTIWWKQIGIYILHYLLHTVILSWTIGPHCLVYQYICIEHQFVVSALFIEPQFWLIFVVALYTKLDNHGNKKLDKIFICKTIIYIHVHISLMLLNFMKSIKKLPSQILTKPQYTTYFN